MVLPGGRPKEESPRFPGDVARDLVHLGARLDVLGRIGSANVVGDRDGPRMIFAFSVLPGGNRCGPSLLTVRGWRLGLRLPRDYGSAARFAARRCHAPPPLSTHPTLPRSG